MAKKKGPAKPKSRSSKAGKAARPFGVAFALTVALVVLLALLWKVYGLDGYTPRITFTGWPALGVLAIAALGGFAYWRGGKPAFWGVLVAVVAAAVAVAYATDAVAFPF